MVGGRGTVYGMNVFVLLVMESPAALVDFMRKVYNTPLDRSVKSKLVDKSGNEMYAPPFNEYLYSVIVELLLDPGVKFTVAVPSPSVIVPMVGGAGKVYGVAVLSDELLDSPMAFTAIKVM